MSSNLSEDQLDEAREAFKLADKTSSGSISAKQAPVTTKLEKLQIQFSVTSPLILSDGDEGSGTGSFR